MKKNICIIVFIATMFLSAGSLFSSVYQMCIYKVRIKSVSNSVTYNKKKKSYTQRIKFTIISCIKSGGFHPGMCKMSINSTLTENILLANKTYSRFLKTGKIIKLKYNSASGMNKKGGYSWHNWRFIK